MINYLFYLCLLLPACAARFDVTRNLKNFVNFFGTKQGLNNNWHNLQLVAVTHDKHAAPATLEHGSAGLQCGGTHPICRKNLKVAGFLLYLYISIK
jgi:hypothetical protein